MQFDLENQGEWFPFFTSETKGNGEVIYHEPIEGAGKVCLRVIDSEALENIEAKTHGKPKIEYICNSISRAMERVTYSDQTSEQKKEERKLIWDYVIVDWEDLRDKKGVLIPCNPENKIRMMEIRQFSQFVARCLQIIGNKAVEVKGTAIKN